MSLRVCAGSLGRFFVGLSSLGLFLSLLGRGHWIIEGAAYWIPLYAALAFCGALLCAAVFFWRWVALGLLASCLAILMILPLYFPAQHAAPAGQAANLRALQANVYEDRGDPVLLQDLIRQENPDLLLFQEYKVGWGTAMAVLEQDYPHYDLLPRYPKGSEHLGQYHRLAGNSFEALADRGVPAVKIELVVQGAPVTVLNVHTAAPFSPGRARRYHDQMKALSRYVQELEGPVLLFGDLNSGPWSRVYRNFLKETGLVSARQGRGLVGTWPSFFGPLRTSIDHALVSPEIQVVDCHVGSGIWSDHRPLISAYYIAPKMPSDD